MVKIPKSVELFSVSRGAAKGSCVSIARHATGLGLTAGFYSGIFLFQLSQMSEMIFFLEFFTLVSALLARELYN